MQMRRAFLFVLLALVPTVASAMSYRYSSGKLGTSVSAMNTSI